MPERTDEPPIDSSPEERAERWTRALRWGTPEQLAARGIEPLNDSPTLTVGTVLLAAVVVLTAVLLVVAL